MNSPHGRDTPYFLEESRLAPFGEHNGAISSNFGRDSILDIRFADEDDRFRDKPRGYYQEHEQKLLSGPEPGRPTFQSETRIAIDPSSFQPRPIGTSCPSSPQPYEMTPDEIPPRRPEMEETRNTCECAIGVIDSVSSMMSELQNIMQGIGMNPEYPEEVYVEEDTDDMIEEERRRDEEVQKLIAAVEEEKSRNERGIRELTDKMRALIQEQESQNQKPNSSTQREYGVHEITAVEYQNLMEEMRQMRKENEQTVEELSRALLEMKEELRRTRKQIKDNRENFSQEHCKLHEEIQELATETRSQIEDARMTIQREIERNKSQLYEWLTKDLRIMLTSVIQTVKSGNVENQKQSEKQLDQLKMKMCEILGQTAAQLANYVENLMKIDQKGREADKEQMYKWLTKDMKHTLMITIENIKKENEEGRKENEAQIQHLKQQICEEFEEISSKLANYIRDLTEIDKRGREEEKGQLYRWLANDLKITLISMAESIKREETETRKQNREQILELKKQIQDGVEQGATEVHLRKYLQEVGNAILANLEKNKKDIMDLQESNTTRKGEGNTTNRDTDQRENERLVQKIKEIKHQIKNMMDEITKRTEERQQQIDLLLPKIQEKMEAIRNQLYDRLSQDMERTVQQTKEELQGNIDDIAERLDGIPRITGKQTQETQRRKRRRPYPRNMTEFNDPGSGSQENEQESRNPNHRRRSHHHHGHREEEEEEENDEQPEVISTRGKTLKDKLIAALKEKDDIVTAMKINKLREKARNTGSLIDENTQIIDAIVCTDSTLWPPTGSTCKICNEHIHLTGLERHHREVHNQEMKDEMIEIAEKLTDSRIEEKNIITIGERQQQMRKRVHRCHYIGCPYENENYMNVLEHRDKHENWKRRVAILGVFWGKIKQEIQLSEQVENLPTLRELMGETIEFRCSCGFGSYTRERVERHKNERRHFNDIIIREICFENTNGETMQRPEEPEEQTIDNPDQRYTLENKEAELQRNHIEKEELETAIRQNVQTRTQFITRMLGGKDILMAARAFINLRYRNRAGETHSMITLDSPISEVLLRLNETHFPPVDKRKFCPHCNKLFPSHRAFAEHAKNLMEQENNCIGLEDSRNMFIRATVGPVRQFATNVLGETLQQDQTIYRCRCPGCSFISLDPRITERHLIQMRDQRHRTFIEESGIVGETLANIRGHIRKSGKMPTVREFLGDNGTSHRTCNLCGEIMSVNSTELHGRKHEGWASLSAEEKTRLIKIGFTLHNEPQDDEVNQQRDQLFTNGSRRTFEEAVDRIYATMMRQDIAEEERRGQEVEEYLRQRREEQMETMEEQTQQQEQEHQHITSQAAERTENTEEVQSQEEADTTADSQDSIIEQVTDTPESLTEYLLSDNNPKDTEPVLLHLLEQLPTEGEWSQEEKIVDTLQYLDRTILTKFGKQCLYCEKQIDTEQGLFTHMRKEHDAPRTDWFILALAKATQKNIEIIVTDTEGKSEKHITSLCHEPGCNYQQVDKEGLRVHSKRMHDNVEEDIDKWGILLSVARRYVRNNRNATWRDILHPRQAYQCECGAVLRDETAINKHFSMVHSESARIGWRAKFKPVTVDIEIAAQNQERNEVVEDHENTTETERETIGHAQRQPEAEPERNQRPTIRNNDTPPQQERIEFYIRRRQELVELEERGVNLRVINKKEAAKVKEGLQSLLKNEIIPKIKLMTPQSESQKEWLAFEGAYLECLHILRNHVAQAQGIPEDKIYRQRKPRKSLDRMKLKQMEEQKTSKVISKLRKWIRMEVEEEEVENDGINPRQNRTRAWRHAKITEGLEHLKRTGLLDTEEDVSTWFLQLQDSAEQQQRVLRWLDELLTWSLQKQQDNTFSKETIREAYKDDPKTAMRHYIIKEQSPQCPINTQTIQEHYEKIWAASPDPFIEAGPDSPFHITRKCFMTDEEFKRQLLDKDLIRKIIKTRRKLSANGPDGIGYRVIQLGGNEAVEFLQIIFDIIWEARKVPDTWKRAKTILLHKKGDLDTITNWRPISLTNGIYRIFTASIAQVIQNINYSEEIFSHAQKGFIARCNGCTEHSIMVNELFNDARRRNTNLLTLTIDCTNAFGSVPLELITSTLRQRGIPDTVVEIIRDTYNRAATTIATAKGTTDKILWRKGVKQGCPLSPLLFNLCLEPLFAALHSQNTEDGVIRWIGHDKIQIQAQAYADDIILITDSLPSMERLIRTTENFLKWSQMEVNAKKCFLASYVKDKNGHRGSIPTIQLNREQVKGLSLGESMQYLGVAVAARRSIRFKNNESAVETFLTLLEKITKSALTFSQKIHAMRMFLIPTLDYVLLNGELRQTTASKLDKQIRARINTELGVRGLPKAAVHASWKDGGLSIPSIRDRQNVLTLRSFIQMMNSDDTNVKLMMRQAVQDERNFRRIRSGENTTFLDWESEDMGARTGTGTIIVRARYANQELGTKITMTENGATVTARGTTFVQKENKRKTLGWFITNAVIRTKYIQDIKENKMKGDAFQDLTNNKPSNAGVANACPYSDNIVKFVTAARCNLLATPNNIAIWTHQEPPICTCGKRENAKITLKHILNDCGFHTALYKRRHDAVMQVIRELVLENEETEILAEDNTPEGGGNMRPDLVVKTQNRIIIIDATCPYGGSLFPREDESEDRNARSSLRKAFQTKMTKYTPLKQSLETRHEQTTEILPVVVSSLGAVYKGTTSEIARQFKLPKKKENKLLRRLSRTAIEGSYRIWKELTIRKERDENNANPRGDREEEENPEENRQQQEEESDNEEEDPNQGDLEWSPEIRRLLLIDNEG